MKHLTALSHIVDFFEAFSALSKSSSSDLRLHIDRRIRLDPQMLAGRPHHLVLHWLTLVLAQEHALVQLVPALQLKLHSYCLNLHLTLRLNAQIDACTSLAIETGLAGWHQPIDLQTPHAYHANTINAGKPAMD